MKRVPLVLTLVVILGCTLSHPVKVVEAPYAGPDGAIRGMVVDTGGIPLPGVTVVLHTKPKGGEIAHVTDARGEYQFFHVTPGVYQLEAQLTGFVPRVAVINVKQGVESGVNLTLSMG